MLGFPNCGPKTGINVVEFLMSFSVLMSLQKLTFEEKKKAVVNGPRTSCQSFVDSFSKSRRQNGTRSTLREAPSLYFRLDHKLEIRCRIITLKIVIIIIVKTQQWHQKTHSASNFFFLLSINME